MRTGGFYGLIRRTDDDRWTCFVSVWDEPDGRWLIQGQRRPPGEDSGAAYL